MVGKSCSDGSSCPDTEVCCPYYANAADDDQAGKGFLCCNPPADGRNASATCCGGGCCDPVETCAADDQGYACCVEQTTFVCGAQQEIGLPSRCCPRQTVCASVGTVGCADPAKPWQITDPSASTRRGGRAPHPFREAADAADDADIIAAAGVLDAAATAGELAYALFVTGSKLNALAINITDGTVLNKVAVTGYDNHQESTRMFTFDSKRSAFHLVEATFTEARPAAGRPLTLYSVDARSGATTARPLGGGAADFPTGFAYHAASDSLLLATEARAVDAADADAVTGHNFHRVDVDAAVATHVSASTRDPAKEEDAAFYAGYISAASADGQAAYRLGFASVVAGTGAGLGTTDLSAAAARASWRADVPRAPGCGFPMSLQPSVDGGSFVSLAAQTAGTQSLSVVRWTAGANATAVAALSNVHPPRQPKLGPLGYMADALVGDLYAALATKYAKIPVLDSWVLAVVDLASGRARELPLKPALLGGTASVSGFGFPAPSAK